MSKQENRNKAQQAPSNVVELPKSCPAEDCGKKVTKSSFCEEHFVWFKEGLINRAGEKPKDFDKKFQYFMQKQKKSA